MGTKALNLLLAIVALLVMGCASNPEPLTDETAANMSRIAGGATSGETKNVGVQPAVAASYMGSATSVANSTKGAEITKTNTAGAPLQVGWSFAATVGSLQKAMSEAATASPTMAALKAQLDRLAAAEEPDEAAITAIIDRIRAEEGGLREALAKGGGDLSGLTTLTQVFTLINTGGADHPISAEVAEQLSKVEGVAGQAPKIVEKAKE